ncbi:MAG: hypothetical protein F2813_01305 [Actinobacteria bacterium]|uniref:Unannotated protein n=1 Tax=freshwater metagenome TaxID=449393 RepID=A0A6J5Z362_9ZZZZ|nr:hypothetical protein [Actinomycetota bacterium]
MGNETIILLVGASSVVFGVAAWAGLIALPAWQSYSTLWQRIAGVFLSLYLVAAFVVLGVGLGALVIWFWDRVST